MFVAPYNPPKELHITPNIMMKRLPEPYPQSQCFQCFDSGDSSLENCLSIQNDSLKFLKVTLAIHQPIQYIYQEQVSFASTTEVISKVYYALIHFT